jgi:hypothetical protein
MSSGKKFAGVNSRAARIIGILQASLADHLQVTGWHILVSRWNYL